MSDNAAILEGFTVEVTAEYQLDTLYLLVRPDTDYDSRFKAWDMDGQEYIRVNGWPATISEPEPVAPLYRAEVPGTDYRHSVFAVIVDGEVMLTRDKVNGDLALTSFAYFASDATRGRAAYLIFSHSDSNGNELYAEIIRSKRNGT